MQVFLQLDTFFVLNVAHVLCIFWFADSAFKQQRLPAWQPILTAGTVLPAFFVIGVAFIPIGIGMLWFSDSVSTIKFSTAKNLAG